MTPATRDTTWLSTLLAPQGALRRTARRLPAAALAAGLPPAWLGYQWGAEESVRQHLRRHAGLVGGGRTGSYETVHPAAVARNPLPRNVASRESLPAERGWWGYSFRDVPARAGGETFLATLHDCRLVFHRDGRGEFHVAVLGPDGRSLRLRETRFRPGHARALRTLRRPARLERATWILERVYENYSHWLTAHLSKLCLLRSRGALADVVLPRAPTGFLRESLRMLGIGPADARTFDPTRPLEVGELTVLGTDRFRPELLRPVREALGVLRPSAGRRIFLGRARCSRRRLVGEQRIRGLLRAAGFECFDAEDLTFEEQVRLMGETSVLIGPHGAGLTNMMFCPPGAHVIEIADPGFPNPNFYALASAMQHHYWWVHAESVGDGPPLERDLRVDERAVVDVLRRLDREPEAAG